MGNVFDILIIDLIQIVVHIYSRDNLNFTIVLNNHYIICKNIILFSLYYYIK